MSSTSKDSFNLYQQAINSIGSILINYDLTQQIPTYGFGAELNFPNLKYPQTSHFFPCSGSQNNSQGFGIQGVFDLYTFALKNVKLSGPTFFAPMLTDLVYKVQQSVETDPTRYFIFLILTDGAIHDMWKTIDVIVEASRLPISVIIVGIGNADFSIME